jgi:hypothetical protein
LGEKAENRDERSGGQKRQDSFSATPDAEVETLKISPGVALENRKL